MKLLLLLTTLALAAQTRLPIDQLKGPPGEVRLLALDATGKPITLTLGEGLAIIDGKIRTRAETVPTGWTITKAEYLLVRAEDGTYSAAEDYAIYRNGMMMSVGSDYTLVNGRIRPAEPWAATDTVIAVFFRVVPVLPSIDPVRP